MKELTDGLEIYLGTSPFVALVAAYLGGVLASLAPCVYPMVPVVSGYVGARTLGGGRGRRIEAFLLSVGYVVGMAAVYSLLGVLAAVGGTFFGAIATSFWALFLVGNFMLLFALNILDVIPLPPLPSFNIPAGRGRGIPGALLLGAASGLVASPCTSPALAVLLTYAATTGNALFGGSLLFFFSFGMGTLLLVVGTFSGLAASLPRPGRWMLWAKRGLGILMLLLAEYFLLRAGQQWF